MIRCLSCLVVVLALLVTLAHGDTMVRKRSLFVVEDEHALMEDGHTMMEDTIKQALDLETETNNLRVLATGGGNGGVRRSLKSSKKSESYSASKSSKKSGGKGTDNNKSTKKNKLKDSTDMWEMVFSSMSMCLSY